MRWSKRRQKERRQKKKRRGAETSEGMQRAPRDAEERETMRGISKKL